MLALAGILTIISHRWKRRLVPLLRRSPTPRRPARGWIPSAVALLVLLARVAVAADIPADTSNYRALLRKLEPGDTLKLAPGTYPRLRIDGINGEPDAWITITGPPSGPPAVIQAAIHETIRADVIDINNSSYVAIENLRIDSRGIEGAFGIAAHGHDANVTHHIRVEGNVFVGQNGGQQTDAISTKTPTWGWIIRRNQILGAGTGLYLGESDGSMPFVEGVIENNLIKDTIGYNMQIKHQKYLPEVEGMPMGPTSTIIRHNVFIKSDQASPDGDRPNLLLGSLPFTGPGSLNSYEVYGNYFSGNHREALFQASGRVTVHDNIFVDGPYTYSALVLRKDDDPLKIAYIYNNTIYTSGRGIYFGSRAAIDDAVVGNLIFASTPFAGAIMRNVSNIVDIPANAHKYLTTPSFEIGSADFYPLKGQCVGIPIDLSMFHTDVAYAVDFNGVPKVRARGSVVFRGAYAGEAKNPGRPVQAALKESVNSTSEPAPVLVWITPASGQPGVTRRVSLTGMNFTPESTISVSGTGVSVANIKVDSATEMTATLTIASTAAAGVRDVLVSTAAGSSDPLAFRVTGRAARATQRTSQR
jgi:hypothetical protein